jgi:hypothetical protein
LCRQVGPRAQAPHRRPEPRTDSEWPEFEQFVRNRELVIPWHGEGTICPWSVAKSDISFRIAGAAGFAGPRGMTLPQAVLRVAKPRLQLEGAGD